MTFSLSIDSMLRVIYARSAMAYAGSRADRRPEVLRREHEAALRELLRASFAGVCLRLLRHIRSVNFDDVDIARDSFLVVEFDLPPGVDGAAICTAMETAVAMKALAGVMTDAGASEAAREAEEALSTVTAYASLRDAGRSGIVAAGI